MYMSAPRMPNVVKYGISVWYQRRSWNGTIYQLHLAIGRFLKFAVTVLSPEYAVCPSLELIECCKTSGTGDYAGF